MPSKQVYNVCFTAWKTPIFFDNKFSYMIYGIETCPETGKEHFQGYLECEKKMTFEGIKKTLNDSKVHLEVRKGTQEQAINYCKKDGLWYEYGTPKSQGKRNDLIAMKNDIMQGRKVDDIALEEPNIYHQYGRTLSKIEDLRMRKLFRTEAPEVVWYFGATGVGKSHKAYENYNSDTHYNWKYDGDWQDGYAQQDIVIINEFRGSIPYGLLLQLCDKYPYDLRRRNREPIPFISKKIIITSCDPPEKVYSKLSMTDSLDQLYRRIEVYKVTRDASMPECQMTRHHWIKDYQSEDDDESTAFF